MGIHSNLVFAKSFLDPVVQTCTSSYHKTWSAENTIRYSSRVEELFEAGSDKLMIISIKPSFMRDFGPKEKEFIYEILRGVSIEFPKVKFLLEDLRQLFKNSNYQNDRYFYLESITDEMFSYELDCKLTPETESRRKYYRKLSSKFGKNSLTLSQVFDKYFFTDFIELNKKQAKKKQRHKGYRDHGSLGSEFWRTKKQQSGDWSIREREEQKKKSREDLLSFLHGFAGWE